MALVSRSLSATNSPCLNPDFSRNEEPAEFSPPQGRYNTLQEGV
jgi:hypothetical protein